jgi:hypothetical protein
MKFRIVSLAAFFILVSCSGLPEQEKAIEPLKLANLGPAPELTSATWINIDHPLRLADLGGQVVLVDMWIFG